MNDINPGNVGLIYKPTARNALERERESVPAINPPHHGTRPTHAKTNSNRLKRRLRPSVSSRRRFLHWISALALIALYLPLNSIGIDTHKLIGTLVLGLFFARMIASLSGDRVSHTKHGKIENLAAVAIQGFILCALLVLPISGLLIHSMSGPGIAIGGFSEQFLKFPASSPSLVRWLTRLHFFLSTTLLIAIFFHVSGALKHHFVERDDTLVRMLTGGLKSNDLSTYTSLSIIHRGRLLSLAIMAALIVGVSWIHVNEETQADELENLQTRIKTDAPKDTYTLSTLEQSDIAIAGRHHGRAFEAIFSNFMVNLDLTDDGEPTSVEIAIDAGSFRSDLLRRDKLVAGEHWLNTETYPLIEYRSSRFKKLDKNNWIANGYLSFKKYSVSVPVKFEITTLSGNENELTATGHISLDRFSLGLGIGPWFNTTTVARSFDLTYRINLSKADSD